MIKTTKPQLLPDKQDKLKQIYAKLLSTQCTESSLVEIELLFFDVLSLLRNAADLPEVDDHVSKMMLIQEKEYKFLQNKQLTIKNKVLAIKRFENAFRHVLRIAVKKPK